MINQMEARAIMNVARQDNDKLLHSVVEDGIRVSSQLGYSWYIHDGETVNYDALVALAEELRENGFYASIDPITDTSLPWRFNRQYRLIVYWGEN